MEFKREMATIMILVGYIVFNIGLCVGMNQRIKRLDKETEILVNKMVDDLEECLKQQNQDLYGKEEKTK